MSRRALIGSSFLFIAIIGIGFFLATWKFASIRESNAAAASQPEPMESVSVATATERQHTQTTTSIGTVTALRSITLKNELAGTVKRVSMTPGQIVNQGALLVQLDVAVEEAEIKEHQARATMAESLVKRMETIGARAVSQTEVDRARSEYQVAMAQIERTKAIIARKKIRAPFRAQVGISDVHPGQYLGEGTTLTTLQGVGEAVHVDFTVPQQVAVGLRNGDMVAVINTDERKPVSAKIIAVDAKVDSGTRNTMVRARIEDTEDTTAPAPGASVRVEVPVGAPVQAVAIPVSALRKGPQGEHVFVIEKDVSGKFRARQREVRSGAMLGDEALVLSGIKAGEQVASSGSFKLRENALVVVVPNANQ